MIFQHAHRDFALIFRFPKPHTISYAFLPAFYSSILSAKKISFVYACFRDTIYSELNFSPIFAIPTLRLHMMSTIPSSDSLSLI